MKHWILKWEPDPEASPFHCSNEQEELGNQRGDFEDPIKRKALDWAVKLDQSEKKEGEQEG